MPGGLPDCKSVCHGISYGVAAGAGTTITGAGSANTKGAWIQLTASTTADSCFMLVTIYFNETTSVTTEMVLDIGVGAGGSEQVVVANLFTIGRYPRIYGFPISIPAGTRVAARSQSTVAGDTTIGAGVTLFDGDFGFEGIAGVDCLSFVSAATHGTAVNGAFSQLIASTARDYCGLFAATDDQGSAGTIGQFDIAVGAGGSEVIIVPGWLNAEITGLTGNPTPVIPLSIPAGSRLSAKYTASAGGNTMGLLLYGLYQ